MGSGVRHVWVRRNYGKRWMPGLVVDWRVTIIQTGHRWDALCIVIDGDRSWLEWFGPDEMIPIHSEPPAITN